MLPAPKRDASDIIQKTSPKTLLTSLDFLNRKKESMRNKTVSNDIAEPFFCSIVKFKMTFGK